MPGIPVIAAAGVAVALGWFDPRSRATPDDDEKGMP